MNYRRVIALVGVVPVLAVFGAIGTGGPASGAEPLLHKVVTGKVARPVLPVYSHGRQVGVRQLPFLSGGLLRAAAEAAGTGVSAAGERVEAADGDRTSTVRADVAIQPNALGCRNRNTDGDVRVNQDCTFRRQAEEDITHNPVNPANLLGGQNDSRVGYNQCGIDYSLDNGRTWGDLLPPFRQKINFPHGEAATAADPNRHTILGGPGTLHTYDAGSDPTVAFDSAGRGFFSCVAFDVASNASLLYVTTSPRGAGGSYFYNLAATDRRFVVAEDNSPLAFHDKNFITADAHKTSPNRDNVYVTWTVFRFNAAGAYQRSSIYGSMSTDHGFTWSTPEEISGVSRKLCSFGNAFNPKLNPHACNFDQGSDPITMPNGDLVVTFNNSNTTTADQQQLAVSCRPRGRSTAGTAHFNCTAPSKVGDDIVTGQPRCDFGRGPEECVPGPYIRTNDFPRIGASDANGNVYVSWQDYRNGEYDIQLARSSDGGRSWSSTSTVNPDRGLDHYMPAVDVAEAAGDRIGVSYYRSERVRNENRTPEDGFVPGRDAGVQARMSDYVIAGGTGLATPYNFVRISPRFAPPDGLQIGFNGDYSGLTINVGTQAHPIWSDTRNANPDPVNGVVHDEDVFSTSVGLPAGVAQASRAVTVG